jgi:hypothetical protein
MSEQTSEQESTGSLTIKVLDHDKAVQVFQDFRTWREAYLRKANTETERTIQLHRDQASFFEKLAVLDAGVLVFFLNFLMTHPAGSLTKGAMFWGLFCPAAVLLLLAFCLSGLCIIGFLAANRTMSINLSKLWFRYDHDMMGTISTKLSTTVGGTLHIDTESVDLTKLLSIMPLLLNKEASEYELAVKKESTKHDTGSVLGRCALMFTMTAIVLLCVFTIKAL